MVRLEFGTHDINHLLSIVQNTSLVVWIFLLLCSPNLSCNVQTLFSNVFLQLANTVGYFHFFEKNAHCLKVGHRAACWQMVSVCRQWLARHPQVIRTPCVCNCWHNCTHFKERNWMAVRLWRKLVIRALADSLHLWCIQLKAATIRHWRERHTPSLIPAIRRYNELFLEF